MMYLIDGLVLLLMNLLPTLRNYIESHFNFYEPFIKTFFLYFMFLSLKEII